MTQVKVGLWAMLILVTTTVYADGQSSAHQKVAETITLTADPSKVWALVGNFEEVARWNPTVEKSLAIDESQSSPTRLVVFKNHGGREIDVLDERDDTQMTLRYHRLSGSLPLSSYRVVLRVSPGPAPGTSVVSWQGSYVAVATESDPDSPPPPSGMPARGPMIYGFDVETYDNGLTPVAHSVRDPHIGNLLSEQYRAGLEGLKWLVER